MTRDELNAIRERVRCRQAVADRVMEVCRVDMLSETDRDRAALLLLVDELLGQIQCDYDEWDAKVRSKPRGLKF